MFDLSGKTALVTGASGGIGGAIARALHRQGAAVLLAGTRQPALEALAAELGERAHIFVADLADPAAADAAGEAAPRRRMGKLDILVNNAGLTRDGSDAAHEGRGLAEGARGQSDRRLPPGARGAARHDAPARPAGSSASPRWSASPAIPGQANYAASKAGMIGMSKALAAEVASRGITVNCVAPGFIATAMTEALTPSSKQRIARRHPDGAHRRAGGGGGRVRLSGQRRGRPMSPARPCMSTAEWR